MHLSARMPSRRLSRITRRAGAHYEQHLQAKGALAMTVLSRGHSDLAPPDAAPGKPGSSEAGAAVTLVEGCRRRSPRTAVSGEVGVRRLGSFNFQAGLRDVSAGGCRVELLELYEVGDRVVTRFPLLEPLGARICWAAGVTAGLEFLTPIHPAVFELLLLRLPKPRPATAAS